MTPRPLTDAGMSRLLNDADLADLLPVMLAAGKRLRGPSTERDGLRGSDYASASSPETCSCPDDGTRDCPHGTPTERAALGRHEPDPQAEAYWQTVEAARRVIAEKKIAYAGRDKILNAVNTADLNPEPGCEVMAKVGVFEYVYRRTVIDGKTWALGQWAYDFHRRIGRFPTKSESEAHAQGRRVRISA